MHPIVRLFLIFVVFITTCIAWLSLGGVMLDRTHGNRDALHGQIAELWGSSQSQQAPTLVFHWTTSEEQVRTETADGETREIREWVEVHHQEVVSPDSTRATVDLALDPRRKGLLWYALYDVDFQGAWTYTHDQEQEGRLELRFAFPDHNGIYDGFHFVVDGEDLAGSLQPSGGGLVSDLPVTRGQTVALELGYRSRGMDTWRYEPAPEVASLEDFAVTLTTDFSDIDFPPFAMSPSSREQTARGWELSWAFDQVVTGHDLGMVMPQRVQPGPLGAELAFSAPFSLFFFLLVLEALGALRGIAIHPVNHAFLAAAFFAFHLLFSYTADHLAIEQAFAIASAVSLFLVVSYLRLVVSPRFALLQAGTAQLIYLVGFSLAHFWEGYTGLTVTVLSVGTLFLLMQLTGRLDWNEVFVRARPLPQSSPASP